MADIDALLAIQSSIEGDIQQLLTNFKKDSQERKTIDYFNIRFQNLDSLWQMFAANHIKLISKLPEDNDYLTGNYYQVLRNLYLETRECLEKAKVKLHPDSGSNSTGNNKNDNENQGNNDDRERRSTGTHSKLDEMLKKQLSNFKAFARTISNIHLDDIKEKWEFEDCLKVLQARWIVIDTLHWEIDSELDGSNKQYEDRFTEHELKYNNMKRAINSKLWSVAHREKSTPQLDIPIFNGNYQQWVPFKDLFSEAIHNNPSLSNAQKLQFLKSKLKGEAERLIQHLQISSENYLTSWEILNHRYNNKKLIFTTHMNTLMNLPAMQQATSNNMKRIHDVTCECLNAIKNLGVNIDTWDPILVHILVQKLDAETHSDYLESLKEPRELPTLSEFLNFMENKFTSMESARRKQENNPQKSVSYNSNKHERSYNFKYTSNKAISQPSNKPKFNKIKCSICDSDEHRIYYCKQFTELTPAQKRHKIAQLNFCSNCLFSHNGKPCTSNKRCRECNGNHNSILHEAYAKGNNMTPPEATSWATSKSAPSTSHADNLPRRGEQSTHVAQQCDTLEILLATALIKVQKADGDYITLRALIDQGSQVSLITENATQLLRIPRNKCRGIITGVGTKDNTCTGMININCRSNTENFTFNTDVYIMKSLTRCLPNCSFIKPTWSFLQKIKLADPDFNISKEIDILLGADVYSNIMQSGIYKADHGSPIAQQTRLGWILCGKVQTLQCNIIINNTDEIQKFWEIEDIPENSSYTNEDNKCIDFYKSTTTRSSDGKYQVRIPLKSNIDQLGQSRNKAVAQFLQLERKFKKNSEIKYKYQLFIHEYQELGHMKPAGGNTMPEYYLPHHCVLREESTTTKLRVVFNGSETTSHGTSLNDCMCKGPNLQKDLLSMILSWRQYKVALTADIEKMFRQIWVQEIDQGMQKIVWRDDPQELLQEYQLTTVTYGTKAAPFLAMMTLQQLAEDEQGSYPEAASVVKNCFYMDDLLHGTHSLESAKKLKEDLINIMKAGGFNLRKWNSNYQELSQETGQQGPNNFDFKQAESKKTLGLLWNPDQDIFFFQSRITNSENKDNTKRSLLSDISKLFDPLGWLTPLSTKLKLLFQQVWKTNLDWDDKLPENINLEWQKIKADINNLNKIQIPRWIGTDVTASTLELHGFSDASQKAYACVIYSKLIKSGQPEINLLVGKSRLVPSNKEVSLPRLELSGALLLSKLMCKVVQALSSYQNIKIYGWIDSTAVLGWLQGNPDRWKPFVSHRVQKITDVMPSDCWRYIKSSENPADCSSRGLTASQLHGHPLWWQGPAWLKENTTSYHAQEDYTTNEEMKKVQQVNATTKGSETQGQLINGLLNKYSSFTKVVRVLAWMRRFTTKKQDRKQTAWLHISEIREAKNVIIKQVQQEVFEQEIQNLKENKKVANKSKILNLNPYLDESHVLRVGGRLRNANINQEMKNPIILPQNHRLTELIINHAHVLTLHGGARITLAFTRQKYWVLSGNRTTKKYLHQCVICKRQKPNKQQQIMADLPEARVNPSRPFKHTGVDFTGHVYLKANKGRGIKTTKGYVAVFVCMVTKAVHLELVSDLTTSAFIAALRRMSARRGTPAHVYCDNGRNFVGTSRILQEKYQELKQIFNDELMQEATDMEITFHFNAPSWPSAGGLWEAAVKSFKFHLKRVIGEQRLTYEEFSTLLAQIEAVLNSRPLCAISEDPDDLDYLTPSHFLSSGPVLTLVETERDLRTRWQLTQKIMQDIWSRWRSEYLSQLTARSKWRQPQNNININDVVLVHEDNLPPGKWIMGRVVELHPGKDGHTRVVTLKTKSGHMKRPIIKLSVLTGHEQDTTQNPITSDEETEKQKPTSNKSQNKKSCFTTLFTAMLFFMTILSSAEAFNITKFRDSQSLYFDKVSNMLLIKDEWKLVIYYQMEPYWQGNKALKSYIQTMDASCQVIRDSSHCNAILLQLRHGYNELEYYNQLLFDQNSGERSMRQRRGLIDGVGYVANSLFGVLDERFAEQYKKDINKLQENQNHIVELWKNQTSIVEAENNLLKRTEKVMDQHLKIIKQHFNTLQDALQQVKTAGQENSVINDFAIGTIIASNVLQNLKDIQNTLMDTVTDVYQGSFSLHLLTPNQLIDELSTISSKLPKDVALPIDNIHLDIRKIYNLLKIKTRMIQEFIIFEIKIPLISRETYDILQIYPVPKLQGKNIINIMPVSDYIAINMKKDTFIPMTEIDVRACYIQSTSTYFCHTKKPEYRIKDDKDFCVMEKQECQYTVDECKNKWQESYTTNTYIYFCCDRCHVKTMCENSMTAQQLTGAGLMTVGHGCLIKTEEFTIHTHKLHASEIYVSPDLSAPVTISPINHMINITIPYLTLNNKTHLELEQEATAIQNKIKDLKENAVLTNEVSFHDIHHYAMIYVILSIAAVIGIIVIIKRLKCKWQISETGTADAREAIELETRPPAVAPRPANPSTVTSRLHEDQLHKMRVRGETSNPQQEARRNKSTSPILNKFNEALYPDSR